MEYWEQFELADKTDDSISFNQQETNVTNPNKINNTFETSDNVQRYSSIPERLQGQIIYNTPKKSAVDNVIHAFDMVKNLALIPIHAGQDRIIDNRAAELNTKAVLGTITENEKEELDYLENRTDRYNFGIQPSVNHGVEDVVELNKNRFKKYALQATGEGVVQIADTLKQGGIGGVIGAGIGATGGAISGLVTGGPAGSLAGAFNGMKLGWKLGSGVGATKRAWEIETGFAYQEIKAMSNDMGVNIDETIAKRLSTGVGVINAGLEMLGLNALAKTTPYFNKVLQGAKQGLLKKAITDKAFQETIINAGERTAIILAKDNAVKNTLEYSAVMGEKTAINTTLSSGLSMQARKNVADEIVKESVKQGEKTLAKQGDEVVKAMITEPTTEVLQEVTNILAEELGKQIQGGYSDAMLNQNDDGSYNFNAHIARQNLARAVEAGVMALAPTIIVGGIGRAATARNIAIQKGMTRKEAENFVIGLENNTGKTILDEDTLLNIAKENAKNRKFNRNVKEKYNELLSQGYDKQNAYLGSILNVSQQMGLIYDGDLVSYINQNEDTLLEIAAKEYKDDFYTEVEKQKHQEMLDNGYTEEQAFLGSTMLHAFLNANTISEEEKQNVLNSLYFKKEGNNNAHQTLFDEVYNAINENNLPDADSAYKYSDAGYGYLRSKIEDARQLNENYNKTVENLDNYYQEKINNTKTQKTKDKYQKEYEQKKQQANEMFANTKNNILNSLQNTFNESQNLVLNQPINNNVENEFGQTQEELAEIFKADIQNILNENEVDTSEFNIEDVRIYGSYTTGKNKETSDLDVIVQYSGTMKEDAAFNLLHDTELTITDKNGVERVVDINPINRETSGTIDEHIQYMSGLHYQPNARKSFDDLTEQEKETVFAEEFIDNEQIAKDENILANDIKKHLKGDMSFGTMINFGKAPKILQNFGVPDKIMLMSQNKYDCSTNRKIIKGSIHHISDTVMEKLPELLSDPLIIAMPTDNSNYDGNSRYVVTVNALDNNKKLINVVIDYDWQGNKINIIPTAYGREKFDDYIKECIKQNKIIYTNKKVLTSRTRVQFPRGSKNSKTIITDKEDIIKSVYDKNNIYFQPANAAGAENNEIEVAAREWQEKGTNSQYFKKWFGDSKVVHSSTDKPIIVYHNSDFTFNEFQPNGNIDFPEAVYFSSKKSVAKTYGKNTYACYLKIENPYIVNADGQSYNDFYEHLISDMDYAIRNGHDGVIVRNIRDNWGQDKKGGSIADTYIVFNPEQIKSVDNRGTFDAENPNIYYQPAYNGSPYRFENFSTEHIGTGEGNQAHGWGLYFAKNKNVSEGYRERLTYGQYDKVLYKNEEITDSTKKRRLKAIYDTPFGGKNFVIEQINDSINEVQSRIDRYKNNLNNETNEYQIETYKGAIKNLENEISDFKKDIEFYKNVDVDDISVERNQGQLYEVDIPEDDVLLDEDKKFSEQPKQVQEALKQLYEDNYENYPYDNAKSRLLEIIYTNNTSYKYANNLAYKEGRSIYQYISDMVGSDRSASELLNKYGIKGIKYNGYQDGECYVIFDDKAIDIIKTYYQTGIEDIDNSEKYKNLPQDLKDAIDYIFTGKSVYDVTGDEFPKNGKNLNERVFEYYKENFNNEITVDNIGKIKLDKRSIKDSIYHGINTDKINAFAAVPFVIQQGKVIDVSKENNKNEKRYLFAAPITLKGQEYFCEVVVKSNKDRQGFYIHEIELTEKLADVFSTAQHGTSTSSKSIIADLINNFNPNEQLKNKIFNDTDLAGTDGKRHKTIEEIHEDVRARRTGEQYRGYFKSGKYSSIITLAENADATTIIHELGHFFLKTLNDLSAENKDIRDKLVAVDSWLGRVEGEDYTVSQQEKFATGFEAYLYMGKAPSRRIQSAFEMFKEWIKGIVNQDLLKRIDEHNIHAFEVRDVFDRIFNPNNEVYEEKRNKVEELLEKVERIRLGKGLNDLQKRHRECAYQIVSMATGKNIKYLKTILQSNSDSKRIVNAKERIQNLCENCGDNLSKNSYPMEWLEFYGNNVSLFEEGNDAELALRAFDDIVNRNYVTEVDEWGYIDDLDAQYQYLLKQYEKATEEDKQIVFNAMAEWIDRACGNDAMATEVYIEKMTFDTEEIDRLKKMDEFERAKEKILKAAREISYARLSKDETFKKTVLAIFDGLKFLTLSDKMRLAANVLECPNITFLEARIDSIMDIAKTMLEVNERKRLYRLISEEIAGTKNIKQNNRMVGKYDYTTNKLFDELRVLDKMTREQVREWLDAQDAFQEDLDENQFNTKLKRKFARVKSESAIDIDTQILKDLYDDLRKIKLTARNVKTEQELNKKLNLIDERDEVLKVLRQKKKDENILKKGYLNLFTNWESALNTIFNLNIRNKYSALAQETKADVWAFEQKSKFEDEIAKIYGLKGWNFDREIIKNLATKFEVEQYTYKNIEGEYIVTPVTVSMNKMEILLAYMWDKNEVLHERMVNQFGEEQLFDLFDELTPQDKALGDLMLKLINGFYPQANKVFIQKYGIDLPKVQAYFPSVADRFNEVDLLNDYRQRSLAPSFTKERSASTFIPLKFFNPINLFYKHIDDMAKFIYMSDIADKINHVFRDVAVQKEIKERYGQRALRTFNQNMENFLYPQHEQSDELLKFLNSFIGNVIASCTAIRPVVTFKQLLSACNYSTEMPVDLWVKGFMKALAHPKSTINYMMKIPYLNARFNMGGSDEFSKNMIDNMQTSSLKKIHNLMMINVRLGDMGAIVFGGKPYIDYLINNEGLTEDEATEKFILQTQRTQQSGANSSLSVWQQNASKNPLWRMMTAFKNTPNQYTRLCVDSVINAINGNVSWKYAAKNLFMYLWFQPYLYISATSLGALRFINSGDNDGLLQDLMNSLFDWNKTALPIIGDILNQVQTALISKSKPYGFSSNEILNKLTKSLYDVLNDGVQTEDVIGIIALMLNVKVRIPTEAVIDMASGAGDIFDGEFERGFLKLMGYSSYRAAYAMGEDKEYLKQKRKETRKRKNQRKL